MSIRKISIMGNPILRVPTKPLTKSVIQSAVIQRLIDDMVDTMREYDGVGLAAPQVHENKPIVVLEAVDNSRYKNKEDIPLTILVNPVVTPLTDSMEEGWEGCLSIPDIRGKVPRYTSIRVQAQDRNGKEVDITAKGFYAVVLQHEIDHLNGVLFLDRMKDFSTLTFLREYARYWIDQD
jgi:peptide deformylase